ncbi:MAG: hypothetical protein ACLP01_03975 [Solirubrobacteraceae bacterium]
MQHARQYPQAARWVIGIGHFRGHRRSEQLDPPIRGPLPAPAAVDRLDRDGADAAGPTGLNQLASDDPDVRTSALETAIANRRTLEVYEELAAG